MALLSELLLDYAYNLPYLQIVNSYTIGIELMRGVAGSIGIILTVPLVSLFASVLMKIKFKFIDSPVVSENTV